MINDMKIVYDSTYNYSHNDNEIEKFILNIFSKEEIKGKKILDIACRNGDYSSIFIKLGAKEVHCWDINKKCIDSAKKRFSNHSNIKFTVDDMRNISKINEESYDIIFCKGSIIYLDKKVPISS